MIATIEKLYDLKARLDSDFDEFDRALGKRPFFWKDLGEIKLMQRLLQEYIDEAEEVLFMSQRPK